MNPETMTHAELAAEVRKRAAHGMTTCPTCDQAVKVYKRQIHATLAKAMITLLNAGAAYEPVRVAPLFKGYDGVDVSKLRWWGLTEPGKRGYWKLTDLGVDFIRGEATIPKWAFTFNGKCIGYDGPPVKFGDCLRSPFDYGTEVIGGAGSYSTPA